MRRSCSLGARRPRKAKTSPPCASYGTYSYTPFYVPWVEQQTQLDITPCHDAATGMWEGGSACQGFPLNPEVLLGTWANGCTENLMRSGAGMTCGSGTDAGPITRDAQADRVSDAPTDGGRVAPDATARADRVLAERQERETDRVDEAGRAATAVERAAALRQGPRAPTERVATAQEAAGRRATTAPRAIAGLRVRSVRGARAALPRPPSRSEVAVADSPAITVRERCPWRYFSF